MAPRPTRTDRETTAVAAMELLPDGDPASVARRAPFSDNPEVGARGRRTRERILDAALRVFGEEGYHLCSVDRITAVAGCSRASFYQYFSSKEDVFRHLAGQLGRQVSASIEALGPLTGDAEGWVELRGWVARYAEIYEHFEPVLQTAQAAAESDEAIAGGYARAGERVVAGLRSRLTATRHPRQLDPVMGLVLACLPRAFADLAILRLAAPEAVDDERFGEGLTDVVHRTFFGLRTDVNVHAPAGTPPTPLDFSPLMWQALGEDLTPSGSGRDGSPTVQALLEAGRDVFVARGYHGARIDDVVARAGVSHGAFYRYFDSKAEFAHVLAVRAMQKASTALAEIPDVGALDHAGRATLRRWLRGYNTAQAAEAAMIRVWADASLHDPALRADSAAVLDWGRRRMAAFLRPRAFGDPDTEAMVLVALLGAFGAHTRSNPGIDAAAHIIERGFLGR